VARVIVTRPQAQARAWVEGLRDMGHEPHALPLIDVVPVSGDADANAIQAAWDGLQAVDAVMFVSSPAVLGFFKPNWPLSHIELARSAIEFVAKNCPKLRFWATGPGTVASLRDLGVAHERIDAPTQDTPQFDSEALWRAVQGQVQPGKRMLIVRGRDVGTANSSRDWLAQQISARGGDVQTLVVYERRAPAWQRAEIAQCQRWLQDGSVWLISSSQALRHLPESLDASQAVCVCTHERISEAARARGFAVVCTSRPTLQDVGASIKSLDERRPA
jgi:uroporphyrinogen-III synthase